jgi:hypothetical protein
MMTSGINTVSFGIQALQRQGSPFHRRTDRALTFKRIKKKKVTDFFIGTKANVMPEQIN